jgi:Uma2 family endonuclease
MAAATRGLTYEDLLETPEGDGNRYELLGGELFVSRSPQRSHVFASSRLCFLLGNHVDQRNLGQVFHGPVDVRLTPYDIVVPDIIFLKTDRLHVFGDRLVDGRPDLIVEVLAPTTRARDQIDKAQLYARTGVEEYWIVDPDAHAVTVYALSVGGTLERMSAQVGKVQSRVLPELKLDVVNLFAEIG